MRIPSNAVKFFRTFETYFNDEKYDVKRLTIHTIIILYSYYLNYYNRCDFTHTHFELFQRPSYIIRFK